MPEAALGAEVGGYELTCLVGCGGTANVWKAEHRVSGMRVALKIAGDWLPVTEARRRFARAAKLPERGVPDLPQGIYPDRIRALVRDMLAVEPDERLRSLDEAEALLRQWAADENWPAA